MRAFLSRFIALWRRLTLAPVRYDRYYKFANYHQLGYDPRAIFRARIYAQVWFAIAAVVGIELGILWLYVALQFDHHLINYIVVAFCPLLFLAPTWQFATQHYANAQLGHYIVTNFEISWGIIIASPIVAQVVYQYIFHTAKWNRLGLPSSHGAQRFALPEEINEGRDQLFPPGYDIYLGYDAKTKALQRRFAHDLDLLQPNATRASTSTQITAPAFGILIGILCSLALLPLGKAALLTSLAIVALGAYAGFGFDRNLHHLSSFLPVALGAALGAIVGAASVVIDHAPVLANFELATGIGASAGLIAHYLLQGVQFQLPTVRRDVAIAASLSALLALADLAFGAPWYAAVTTGLSILAIAVRRPRAMPAVATLAAVGLVTLRLLPLAGIRTNSFLLDIVLAALLAIAAVALRPSEQQRANI